MYGYTDYWIRCPQSHGIQFWTSTALGYAKHTYTYRLWFGS